MKTEDALISAIVRGQSVRNALKVGVTRDLFLLRRAEWMWLEANPNATLISFKARFPDFKVYKANEDQIELLARQAASDRANHELARILQRSQRMFGDLEPLELTQKISRDLEHVLQKYSRGQDVNIIEDTVNILAHTKALRAARKNGSTIGWPAGVPTLDEVFGGLTAPDLWAIGARQGEYKTWLSLYFAVNAMVAGAKVMYVSLEMDTSQITYRVHTLLSKLLAQSYSDKFRTVFENRALMMGAVNMKQYRKFLLRAKKHVTRGMVIPDFRTSQSVEQLRGKLEEHKPDLLFYDYFGLAAGDGRVENWMEAEQMSHGFKGLAREYGIPVVLNCQANRKAADDKESPKLDHFAYTDAIGRDADRVLALRVRRGELTAYVLKNRYGPSDQKIRFEIDINKGVLEEITVPGIRRRRFIEDEE